MPRKKRKGGASAPSDSIWCFYCDRTFKDESTLVTHQKAKHYRCSACNKKMNTAQGLQVHCEQVHKLKLTGVPGAKEGRENMQIEIFGMAGIPSDIYQGAPPEQFRKATKRQVMLGAALVDEKGNLRPSAPVNAAPLMTPLLVPPLAPPRPLFQFVSTPNAVLYRARSFFRPGSVPMSSPPAPVQTPAYGGLVSTSQGATLQTSSPLLFPKGAYGTSQSQSGASNSGQGSSSLPQSSAVQTDKSATAPTTIPQTMHAFVFPQSTIMSGVTAPAATPKVRFVWKKEDVSMEEARAALGKYASLNNLA